jgi:hypothetical protein
MLALDAALRAFPASRSIEVPGVPAEFVPERMRRLPLVAEVALHPLDELVARSITPAASVSFDSKQLRADTGTAASVLSRTAVTSSAAGRDHETFFYSGPIDGRMCPVCLGRIGRVFSRRAIDAMDNGRLPNVYLTCDGHQCRHTWLPVPHGGECEGFVDTGQFIEPGYAEDAPHVPEERALLPQALAFGLLDGDLFTHPVAFSPGFLKQVDRNGRPRVFVSHGTCDTVFGICRGRENVRPSREEGYEVTYREFDGGHEVPEAVAHEAFAWLS